MGWTERQHLPEGDAAGGETVDQVVGLIAQRSAGQRGGMEEDARAAMAQDFGSSPFHHPACPVRMTPPMEGAP